MSLFLISFLGIYGGLHAYVLISLRNAFRPSQGMLALLAGVMVLMIVAPVLVRLAEHHGHDGLATALAWPAYLWMGALFLFAAALFFLDLLRMASFGLASLFSLPFPALLSPRITGEIALLAAICATVYGFFEARAIRTEHLTVPSAKIPATVSRIRIVQISDVHLGLLSRERRLERILAEVNAAAPDVLVSTGDLVDGRLSLREGQTGGGIERMLVAVKAPRGKFAVSGNHEVYAGLDHALALTRAAGFMLLRGGSYSVEPYLSIAGVDDPAGLRQGEKASAVPEQELLRKAAPGAFKVLLKHRPQVDPASDGLFDLQLSGHTHQGQIFPFNLLVRLQYPQTSGTARTKAGSLLHVSRGSGTWGPPIRFLAPPEVTIIDLVPAR